MRNIEGTQTIQQHKINNLIKKLSNDLKRHFLKEDIQMSKMYI